MRNSELSKSVSAAGRILLAFLLLFSQSAWASQDQKVKDSAAASPQKAAAQRATEKHSSAAPIAKAQTEEVQGEASETTVARERSSRDGSHEGVKVHGHWTIEVRNPDGSVATHRDFENSLATGTGGGMLVNLLARLFSQGLWAVDVRGDSFAANPGPCPTGGPGTISSCWITEPQVPAGIAPVQFGTLTVTTMNGGPPFPGPGPVPTLVLSGTAVAQADGGIVAVNTDIYQCLPVVAPATPCVPGSMNQAGGYQFTSATVSPPIVVSKGQTIAVTVNISFS